MNARALLAEARRQGFALEIEGPHILLRTKGRKAPPELVEALRAHKPAVLKLLRAAAANDQAAPAPPRNDWTDPAGALALDDARRVEEIDREADLDERIAIAVHDGGVPEPWAAALCGSRFPRPP